MKEIAKFQPTDPKSNKSLSTSNFPVFQRSETIAQMGINKSDGKKKKHRVMSD